MAEDYTWGVPVVPGSDNFLAETPPVCESALDRWTFDIGSGGIKAPPGNSDAFFKPEARLTFSNPMPSASVQLDFSAGVIPDGYGGRLDSIALAPGSSMTLSLLRFTAVMLNFTITCRLDPGGATTRLHCHICPTPIS